LISEIVREASCPVIAVLPAKDPAYVHAAAKRGVFAYIVDSTACRARSDAVRFEQAKGILMARHAIDADRAFASLAAALRPA
jgi:AmiR/NasT family two-component response regulator